MALSVSETILIVEDSDDDFFFTMLAFKENNLHNPVQRCSNGEQALDYLYQRGEFSTPGSATRPGIVLLDLNLPGMDGREVLRNVKSDPQLRQIPIVVLTTSFAKNDIGECNKYGVDSYMKKPVDFDEFVEVFTQIKKCWFEVAALSTESK